MTGSFDVRAAVIGQLDLVNINTADGDFGFMVGTDGSFTDINGKVWVGSTLLAVQGLASAIDGVAPEGRLTLSFFQDPEDAPLISQIHALGVDYIAGRPITFYRQPLLSHEDLWRPQVAPELFMTRTMRKLRTKANNAQDRSIEVTFEAWSEDRRAARRIKLNTEGHKQLLGASNPSLTFMPTTDFEEEKLFG